MIRGTKKVQVFILLLLFGSTTAIWIPLFSLSASSGKLTVAFLSIGQGDAIFIEAPNGMQVLLDGGPNNAVLRELGGVMPFYDHSIDMLIGSHPDLDHIGGLPEVLSRFEVTHIMIPDVGSDSQTYQALLKTAEEKNVPIMFAQRGRMWLDKDRGVYLNILFPDRSVQGVESNLASIVAKLVYGETSFLLTGDSPKAIEKYLVELDGARLNVDVLKVGHHGSKTSTSESFLGVTSPEYAIISAGKDNRYGHPHQEVLDLLEMHGVPYLNTADAGTIVFESDGREVIRK